MPWSVLLTVPTTHWFSKSSWKSIFKGILYHLQ